MTEQEIKEAAEAAYPLESTLPGPYRQRLAFINGATSHAAKEHWTGKQEPIAKTYFFDCWKRDGISKTKTIIASSEKDAKLLFEAKHPDWAFDSPYN